MSTLKLENIKHENSSTNNMVMDSDGSVSITGATTMNSALTVNTATSGLPSINLQHSNSGADNFQLVSGTPGVANSGFSIRDIDAAANRLVINSAGKVGIGTSTPAKPLSVNLAGGGDFIAEFQNTTNATPYGIHVKDAASGANGYPLLQVTNAAGSQTYFRVDSGTGYVTKNQMPGFNISYNAVSGVNATSSTIVLAGSTYYTSSSLQQTGGSNFAVSTGRFTAPITGWYQFNVSIRFDGHSGNYIYITLVDNGASMARNLTSLGFTYMTLTMSSARYLSANDYVEVHLNCSGDTSVVLDGDSFFSGYLIG